MRTCNYDNKCLFCKICKKEITSHIIFENEYTLAFLDIFPITYGHCLVIPKSHFIDYSSTNEFYLKEVAKTSKKIAKLLYKKIDGIVGINYLVNEKEKAGQKIFHLHQHIIPKYELLKNHNLIDNKNLKLSENDFKKILEKLK